MGEMYERWLDEATNVFRRHGKEEGEPIWQHSMQQLAQVPEKSMPVLLQAIQSNDLRRAATAIDVLNLIGFPENEVALPDILNLIGKLNPNRPAWISSGMLLMHLGPDVVVPHLIRALLEKEGAYHKVYADESVNERWAEDVEGLCYLLSRTIIDSEYARRCCPAINYLLAQTQTDSSLNPEVVDSLLDVVAEAIPDVAYLVPTLLFLVKKYRGSEVGKRAETLLFSFPQEMLKPYKLLFSQLSL